MQGAKATLARSAGMALWWAWFVSYFFPRALGAFESFGSEVVWLRCTLMLGFVVGTLAFSAVRGRVRVVAAGGVAGGAVVPAGACCLAMSAASVAFAFAGLGALSAGSLIACIAVGAVGGGAMFLVLFGDVAACGRQEAGRILGCAALLGGAARLAIGLVAGVSSLLADIVCAAVPWILLVSQLAALANASASGQIDEARRPARATPMFAAYALAYGVLFGFMLVLALAGSGTTAASGPGALNALSVAGLVCAGVATCAAYRRATQSYLSLLRIGLLLTTIGLLVLAFLGGEATPLAAFFVAFGYIFYWLLFNVAWVDMAGRENLVSTSVAAWGLALSAAGIAVGAVAAGMSAGQWSQDGRTMALVCVCLCVVLLFMALFMLDSQVFENMGGMVRPAPDPAQPAETDALIARVDAVSARYGLTAREREIALMLARGRNPRAIEERLGISVNTVRTHIHHIYDKCGVHSDQELLDLMENEDAKGDSDGDA